MKWVDRLPVIVTGLVAIAAGVLAAHATRSVAMSSGAVTDPALAWALPAIVEGGAIVSGLLAWQRTRLGQSAWPERGALLALILLAVAVNASHAASGTTLGIVLAACPPLVLVGCVEMLIRQRSASEIVSAERARKEADAERRAARSAERAAARPRSTSRAEVTTSVAPTETHPGDVDEWLREDPSITGVVVAKRLGCSPATGRRRLSEAKARVDSAV